MKILLTGGAGYIGSHTAIKLIEVGYDVIIADNFCNSIPETVGHIELITGAPVSVYEGDVTDKGFLRGIFEGERIDGVIHLAGYKAVGESMREPLRYYRNNIDTTLSLLEVMGEYDCNNLVCCSSATVYGRGTAIPYREACGIGECVNTYGCTKAMMERIVMDASGANPNLSAVILRCFNPIGAHSSGKITSDYQAEPNNLIPHILQVATGKRDRLSIFGSDYQTPDGTCRRDYIHVMDLAEGHLKALEYSSKNGGTEVFNLGSGSAYSVLEVVRAFEGVSGIKIPCEFVPRRDGDLPEFWADITKAKDILGWQAKFTLEKMCEDAWRAK